MTYTRWGMTETDADALTGASGLTEADLHAAETEIVDFIAWQPDPTDYTDANGDPTLAAQGFGRAVAWQAAYRASKPAAADDGAKALASEDLPDYSATFAQPVLDAPMLAQRAATLLANYGWRSQTGKTRTAYPTVPDFQTG